MTAVFFTYVLDTERLFWALWDNMDDLELNLAPLAYDITRKNQTEALVSLYSDYPLARQIFVSSLWAKTIYRQVRRAELPADVQNQIRNAVAFQKKKRLKKYEALGFLKEDMASQAQLKQRYRKLVRKYHPDHGGNRDDFVALQKVYAEILILIGHESV